MSGNTHVPDKLEGYMLQVRHALFELISLDDRIVSVEGYDDVAVETDSTVIAEQTKSVLSKNNPVANKATVFWKALKNWCEYLKSGDLPNKTIVLKYVIVASHNLNIGSIPASFSNADTESEAKAALVSARKELFVEKNGKIVLEAGDSAKQHIEYCFASENESAVLQVISLMKIELHQASYDEELKTKFGNQTIPKEYADVLFLSMLGWVNEKVHEQIKCNKAAYISSQDYRDALQAQIRSRDQRQILTAISFQPEDSRTKAEINKRDTYIRQLELIDADTTKQFQAASDFLRTKAEKTEWASRGIVTQQSFLDYYDSLKRMWDSQRTIVTYLSTPDEKSKGAILLSQCEINANNYRIQGASAPSFFGVGTLHSLANEPSEHPTIGWHPRYVELLKEDKKDDE